MFVSETRKNIEANSFLKEYMLEGKAPTIRELLNHLKDLDSLDLEKSQIDPESLSVEFKESGSAGKQALTYEAVFKDLVVAYTNISQSANVTSSVYNKNILRFNYLLSRLKKIESRLTSLLMLTGLTDGYYKTIEDTLVSLDYVDVENTNLEINTTTHTATIKEEDNPTNLSSRYIPKITEGSNSNVSFGVLNQSNVVLQSPVGDAKITSAFQDQDRPWLHQVVARSPETPVSVELKINFGEVVDIGKILFYKNFPSSRGAASLVVMFSVNGTTWQIVPAPTESFVLQNDLTITFPTIEARYFKFIITKYYYDRENNGQYIYDIGADIIEFYSPSYEADSEISHIYQSLPLSLEDEEGNSLYISKVSLEACEIVDDFNTINYSVSFDEGTTFSPISPSSYTLPSFPKTIEVASTLSQTVYNLNIPSSTNRNSRYRFPFKDNDSNYPLGVSGNLNTFGVTAEELVVYRGVGAQGSYDNTTGTDYSCYSFEGINIPMGWRYDGKYYITVVSIENLLGVTMDFGPNPVIIDNTSYSGVVSLAYGDHLVKVKPANFSPLVKAVGGSFSVGNIVSEEYSESTSMWTFTDADSETYTDPLYPYNHRLLIEGVPYSDDADYLSENKTYIGGTSFSAYKMKRESQFDFEKNVADVDLDKFTVVGGYYDTDGLSSWSLLPGMILVKYNESLYNEDITKEYFTVAASTFDSEALLAESVTVKAELKSTNQSTPQFQGYRLKLGVKKYESE